MGIFVSSISIIMKDPELAPLVKYTRRIQWCQTCTHSCRRPRSHTSAYGGMATKKRAAVQGRRTRASRSRLGRPRRHTGRSLERVEVYHARRGAATAGTPRRRALDGVATPLRCRHRAAASLWAAARCQAARRAPPVVSVGKRLWPTTRPSPGRRTRCAASCGTARAAHEVRCADAAGPSPVLDQPVKHRLHLSRLRPASRTEKASSDSFDYH